MAYEYYPPGGCPNIKYLRLKAKGKRISWKHVDLPACLKKQCIAYCIKEGGNYRIGRPSRNAIIFVFEGGLVYDIAMLLSGDFCWREITAESLKYIYEKIANKEHNRGSR